MIAINIWVVWGLGASANCVSHYATSFYLTIFITTSKHKVENCPNFFRLKRMMLAVDVELL